MDIIEISRAEAETLYPRASNSAPTPNRKERRKSMAQGRALRKRFGAYKAHMNAHGYDATFADFVESMP